jgi:uridine kinase
MTTSFESVSTWRQPLPETTSPCRRHLIDGLAEAVDMLSSGRLRVAVDGRTAAGKTTFAHELTAALRRRGRSTARASLDDFTHPWSHAHRHGYDRVTGEGYYRNAYDFTSATNLLLQPAGSSGSGRVALCAHDPLTAADHRDTIEQLPEDTVLIVDSVFAFRPQYAPFWDYRIWLEIESGLALRRGIIRDNALEGADRPRDDVAPRDASHASRCARWTVAMVSSSSRMNDSSGVAGMPISARGRHVMASSNQTFSTKVACFTKPSSVVREGTNDRRTCSSVSPSKQLLSALRCSSRNISNWARAG